jgi:Tfp pilus assembly PilM family ATPase
VSAIFQFPFVFGVPVLPASRVIAVDPGSRCVKVVLAEVFLKRVRILRREILDLPGPGVAEGEVKGGVAARLAELLHGMGEYPIAIALPQHVSISQVIDLPPVGREAVGRLIQNEAYKLAGLSQSKVAFDHAPMTPYGRHEHSFWVTLSQENEVEAVMLRLGLVRENLCGVTSAGNGLITSYLALFPETGATVVVDLGMRCTTVAILYEGQGVHVTSFALGNELFLDAIAGAHACGSAEAERQQRERNLLSGPDAVAAYVESVDNWRQELTRLVQEWLMDHGNLRQSLDSMQFVLTGGVAGTPGFMGCLNRHRSAPVFGPWPEEPAKSRGPQLYPGAFAVAEGVARQALGRASQPASLLPMDLRQVWRRQRVAHIIQSVTFFCLLLVTGLLAFGSWQKLALAVRKTELQQTVEMAYQRTRRIERLVHEYAVDYDRIRPVLEREQHTVSLLQSLAQIQQVRSNRSYWYVLFADQQSYFNTPVAGAPDTLTTNSFIGPLLTPSEITVAPATNRLVARAGFVAELCIPEEGEAMRSTLSQIVAALKQNPRFKNVDSVPTEQRRPVADPKSLLPEHHFALYLELATNQFQHALLPSSNAPPAAPKTPAWMTPAPAGFGRPGAPPARPDYIP